MFIAGVRKDANARAGGRNLQGSEQALTNH
jgi:hypothetical protein